MDAESNGQATAMDVDRIHDGHEPWAQIAAQMAFPSAFMLANFQET